MLLLLVHSTIEEEDEEEKEEEEKEEEEEELGGSAPTLLRGVRLIIYFFRHFFKVAKSLYRVQCPDGILKLKKYTKENGGCLVAKQTVVAVSCASCASRNRRRSRR